MMISMRTLFGLSVCMLAFAIPSRCDAWQLTVSLVVTQPKGSSSLMQPHFTTCTDCKIVEVHAATGDVEILQAQVKPSVFLSESDFSEVVVASIPISQSDSDAWFVVAVPKSEARRRLRAISAAHPFDRALVALDGKPIDINLIATWSSGVRLRFFRQEDEAKHFPESLGLSLKVEPHQCDPPGRV